MAFGRKTHNARSETAHEKRSFKDSWIKGRRCIVPAEAIFEPNWETGKAVRWRISRRDGKPMGIAGLWGVWRDKLTGKDCPTERMKDFMRPYRAERLEAEASPLRR